MTPEDLTPEQRELYEERAAIKEYCAGMPREQAEREAMEETLAGNRSSAAAR